MTNVDIELIDNQVQEARRFMCVIKAMKTAYQFPEASYEVLDDVSAKLNHLSWIMSEMSKRES